MSFLDPLRYHRALAQHFRICAHRPLICSNKCYATLRFWWKRFWKKRIDMFANAIWTFIYPVVCFATDKQMKCWIYIYMYKYKQSSFNGIPSLSFFSNHITSRQSRFRAVSCSHRLVVAVFGGLAIMHYSTDYCCFDIDYLVLSSFAIQLMK